MIIYNSARIHKHFFVNSDHLLVKSTFNMQSQAQYASYWKFNTKCLMNENIKKDIEEELQGHITIDIGMYLKTGYKLKLDNTSLVHLLKRK